MRCYGVLPGYPTAGTLCFFSKQELVQLIKHYIRGETSGGRNGTGMCSPQEEVQALPDSVKSSWVHNGSTVQLHFAHRQDPFCIWYLI